MTIRKCAICGTSFEAHKRQKYCTPTCAEIGDLRLRRKRCEKEKEKRAKIAEEKRKYRKNGNLTKNAIDARESDMTYGKYMARNYKVTITRH